MPPDTALHLVPMPRPASTKAMAVAQLDADIAAYNQEIGVLMEQRARAEALRKLVSRTPADLIEALGQRMGGHDVRAMLA